MGLKEAEQRRASRLIILDHEGRVLLFRHADRDGGTFWAPPGGGVKAEETFEEAALREADEELGLKGCPIKWLWERWTDFVYIDTPVHQHESYFLLKAEIPPLSAEVLDTHEREGIVEMRWWAASAIDEAREPVFPEDIVSELKRISN